MQLYQKFLLFDTTQTKKNTFFLNIVYKIYELPYGYIIYYIFTCILVNELKSF